MRTSDDGISVEGLTLFDVVVGFCWVEFDNVRVRQWLSIGRRFSSGEINDEWLLFEERRAEIFLFF